MKGKDIPYKMFTFFTILYPSSIFNNYKIIRLLLFFGPVIDCQLSIDCPRSTLLLLSPQP